jgi:GNAT superfamily N-acetyltransferase
MMIVEKPFLVPAEKERVCELWNNEYPHRVSTHIEAFEDYLGRTTHHRHFLMVDDDARITGWAYTFDRDGERWFSIILDRDQQGKGLGRQMLKKLQSTEEALCGWVTDHDDELLSNGQPYKSPLMFYLKIGFVILPEIRFESETMSAVKIRWEKKLMPPGPL